jgi:hypothetical protein
MRSTVAAGMAHPFTQFLFCSSTRKKKALASLQLLAIPTFRPCNACNSSNTLSSLAIPVNTFLPCNVYSTCNALIFPVMLAMGNCNTFLCFV